MIENLVKKVKDQVHSTEGVHIVWKKHYLQIENLVIDALLNLAEDKLIHDADLRLVMNKVFELLPTPVRLVLPRDYCINKILEHKEPILKRLATSKQKRALKKMDLIAEKPKKLSVKATDQATVKKTATTKRTTTNKPTAVSKAKTK